MKRIITIGVAILVTASVFLPQQASAQAPEKMSYQAVVRDGSNNLVTSTAVGMQISILQGSSTGTAVYVETQTPTSNANGLVSLEMGAGTVLSGDFTTIDWSAGSYFIKTETDPTGGTNYTITGTSELLSVPYALHAKTAETITGGITETDPSVPTGTQTGEMQYWDGTAWVTVPVTPNEGATLQMIAGVPTWTGGTPPSPTTGETWMDRNLGAARVATSSTDADSYGDLYQWGRGTDGHQLRTSVSTATLSATDNPGNANFILAPNSPNDWRNPQNVDLWQGVNGANNPCPSGYRLPTASELDAERLSWGTNNAAGAFASPLRLPMAGLRAGTDDSFNGVGTIGGYWSSSAFSGGSYVLAIGSGSALVAGGPRSFGYSVRCIKD